MSSRELKELEKEFHEDCRLIEEECEEEGYPSRGSNYDLRVTQLMESDYYAPLFEEACEAGRKE